MPLVALAGFNNKYGAALHKGAHHDRTTHLPNARRLTEAQERMIWVQEIQPILTKHFNSALRYKWFPEPTVINVG